MYRSIDTAMWTDLKVKALPPEGKLLFVYLITNRHTHVSGIYYLPKILMQHETGLSPKSIDTLLHTLSEGYLAHFSDEHEVVWVVNMMRYQGSHKKLVDAAASHLHSLNHCPLIYDFLRYYNDLKIPFAMPEPKQPYPIDTLSEGYGKGIPQEQEQIQDQKQEGGGDAPTHEIGSTRVVEVRDQPVTSTSTMVMLHPPQHVNGQYIYQAPADFGPSPAMLALATRDCPDVDLPFQTKKFKVTPFHKTVLDWDDRWYRYMLEEQEKAKGKGPAPPRTRDFIAERQAQKEARRQRFVEGGQHERHPDQSRQIMDGDGPIIDSVEYHIE